MSNDIRFISEWEANEYVLLALPTSDTDWDYMLEEALEQYRRLILALANEGVKVLVLCHRHADLEQLLGECPSNVLGIEAHYNDTWTRDYGMLSVVRGERLRALDFGFNGWGLKFASDKDNLVNLRLNEVGLMRRGVYRNERDFVLEGGSVETDGRGTILTTTHCLTSPNRNGGKSKNELTKTLRERLGAEHVLWLDYGGLEGDDTDSHIDTLARLAPDNTILFTGCRNVDDSQFEELLKMRAQLTLFRTIEGHPFNLVELPLPDAIYDEDGQRLPATYANYLVMNGTVFMPTYNQPANDHLACQTIRIAYPNCKIVGVDCRALIKQHGSLHCATMQIPEGIISI